MMQVVYASRGGNTKKLAEAVARAVGARAEAVAETREATGVDLLFVGTSAYGGDMHADMRAYLATLKKEDVARVAVFGSAAGKRSMRDAVAAVLEPIGIPVEGEAFLCKGSFLLLNVGKPDDADIERAEAFAKRVAGAAQRPSADT